MKPNLFQAVRLFGDRKANIIETHMGVGGWTRGFLLCGHNVAAIEINERQIEWAKQNISNVTSDITAMYQKPFRLPMSAVLVDRAHHTPYSKDDKGNKYLPVNALYDPTQGGKTYNAAWRKIFAGASNVLVIMFL